MAAEAEVIGAVLPAVLSSNDVFDVKLSERGVNHGQVAILTAVTSALADEIAKFAKHYIVAERGNRARALA